MHLLRWSRARACSDLGNGVWRMGRIDQRDLPLNQQYGFGSPTSAGTGRGVTIYTLDSGVRLSHKEFVNWPGTSTRVSYGWGLSPRAAT